MASLVAHLEWEFTTDSSILIAGQTELDPAGLMPGAFAVSEPGTISMKAGDKDSHIRARVERWDGRPGWVGDEWEDRDELPWRPVPGGGSLSVWGFDPPAGEGLPVEDLGDSRVQVLARGRHQYSPVPPEGLAEEEVAAESPPEFWLLRLWPVTEPTDALAGPPRSLVGLLPGKHQRSPWEWAVHGWATSGWHRQMTRFEAFWRIGAAVRLVGGPFERDDLLPFLEPFDWLSPVYGSSVPVWPASPSDDRLERLADFATASGLPEIATFADAFTCLLKLGLIGRCDTPDGERLVPNPMPGPVAPALVLPDTARTVRELLISPHVDRAYLGPELDALIRWSPKGLVATPRRVAIRLAVPVEDVVDALRVRAILRPGTVDINPAEIDRDTVITLTAAPLAEEFRPSGQSQ